MPTTFDIVGDPGYCWTLTPSPIAAKIAPRIILVEYRQNASSILASAGYWTMVGAKIMAGVDTGKNPYEGLYMAGGPLNVYVLPFFSEYDHSISQSWGENRGPIGETIDNTLVQVSKIFKPSAGIEPPKAWEGSQAASYSFEFVLYNKTKLHWAHNQIFRNAIIKSALHDRTSPTNSVPPSIFEISIPGVRVSPAATINQLDVSNVGQLHYVEVTEGKPKLVPDGYKFRVGIVELINESTNIFKDVNTQTIRAIVDPAKYWEAVDEATGMTHSEFAPED